MSEELKPCPFCGSPARLNRSKGESLWSHDQVDWTQVQCTNEDCGVATENCCKGWEPTPVEAWNTRALTQRPAALAGERDTGPRVLHEVFALCEDTMTKMESESTEFSRGRAFEAKGISRAIGTWFQDEFCGRSHMGEPVIQPAAQATRASAEDMAVYDGIAAGYFADTQQATSDALAGAWDEGYRRGVEDERTSEANIGVAGFGAKVSPARQNPYRTQQATPEPGLLKTFLAEADRAGVTHLPATFATDLAAATPEPVGEAVAEVVWYDPQLDHFPRKDGHKIIDASMAFMDAAPLGTKLYTRPAPGVPDFANLLKVKEVDWAEDIDHATKLEARAKGWNECREEVLRLLAAAQAKGGE